jgi:RNA polymerase sigma factor (sigma-70 family)
LSDVAGESEEAVPTAGSAVVASIWRQESARVIGGLTRLTRDLDLAEDLAQDALVAALEQWPRDGVPDNPGAWLTAVAKRRAVDGFRRSATLQEKVALLGHDLQEVDRSDLSDAVDAIDDDVLRLIFLACHPSLSPDGRAALTLRLVGGLTTQEIARAFLVKDATVGQRISRAKRTLADVDARFELPTGEQRQARLGDVLSVVYLIFSEGHAATAGRSWARPDLCGEAIRLARLVSDSMPKQAEAHALQALLELQASRLPARTDERGRPVLLEQQDRRRWDHLLMQRGLAALAHAEAAARQAGPYLLQAQIAACHARAGTADATDWDRIARLYDRLEQLGPSPVVTVNRAVAHGRAHGASAGLTILDTVASDPVFARSPILAAVRGDLELRSGRRTDAAASFREAAELTRNEAERSILLRRAAELL